MIYKFMNKNLLCINSAWMTNISRTINVIKVSAPTARPIALDRQCVQRLSQRQVGVKRRERLGGVENWSEVRLQATIGKRQHGRSCCGTSKPSVLLTTKTGRQIANSGRSR